MAEPHTVVIGGGTVGLCAAYFLARRGARVTLLENGHLDDSASTGNAGLIALGHPPLPRPGLAARAARWMFDSGSPLYIPLRADLALARWLWRFSRACRPDRFGRNMAVLAAHGRAAGACFGRLVETEGLACGYAPVGQIEVYRTDAGRRRGEAEAALMRDHGFPVETLDGDAVREREPALRPEVIGAVRYPASAFANPRAFVREMAERAERLGVMLRAETAVERLLVRGGRCAGVATVPGEEISADHAVLAAGIWSSPLARRIGVAIPMQPAKGYHLDLSMPRGRPETACVLAEVFVAATPMDGGLRLAGTLELSGINHRIVQKRVDRLRIGARRYLRGIDEAEIRETWCGLRPCTADGLPVIGWAPRVRNLFVATGHAMMGFTLGPLAGRLASECILDGRPSLDLAPFDPARFRR